LRPLTETCYLDLISGTYPISASIPVVSY
jgi:hypothetical protein